MARKSWRIVLWIAAISVLSAPLIGMRFTDDIQWGIEDFVAMGGMLLALIVAFEFIFRRCNGRMALAAGLVAIVLFLLIWAELAVGVLG